MMSQNSSNETGDFQLRKEVTNKTLASENAGRTPSQLEEGARYEALTLDAKDHPTLGKGFYGRVGNPTVMGLGAHGVTLMSLGVVFCGFRGVTINQAAVGNLCFSAGLYMFVCAQWELVLGNTFAWVVFGSFSGFYLSFAAILIPWFGVTAAFADAPESVMNNALALYVYVWCGIFMIIFLVSLKTNFVFVMIFLGVVVGAFFAGGMYDNLASGATAAAGRYSTAAGSFLFMSAAFGFYATFVQLLAAVDFPFALPMGDLSRFWPKPKPKKA